MRTILLAGLLALAGTATAGPADLSVCFTNAIKQSETYARSGEDIAQAEEHYHQALSAVMPNIGVSGTYLHQDDHAYTSALDSSNPRDQALGRLSLDQPLFRGFREYQALDLVKDSLTAAKEARRWAAYQLYQDVAQAYFLVLSLSRNRDLVQEQLGLYDQRIKELKDFQAIGRSRASDLLTVQATQALLQANSVALGAQINTARQVLAFLTGQPAEQELAGTEPLPADAGQLEALLKAAQDRPDLRAARARVDAAAQGVSIAKGAHLPNADLYANGYTPRPGSNANIWWDASIVVTLPLFQGFYNVSKTREAASLLQQAKLDLARQQRQTDSDVLSAWTALSGDLAQAQALDQAYTLSDQSYAALKRDYAHGLCTNLDVLQALSAASDSKRSLEAVRFNARDDQARLLAVSASLPTLAEDAHDAR